MDAMEFEKRTHLGPLLAAVLVGVLSLVVNRVFKSSPEEVDTLLEHLQTTAEGGWRGLVAPRRPARLVGQLAGTHQHLARIYQSWSATSSIVPDNRIGHLVRDAQHSVNKLGSMEEATANQRKHAEMLMLGVYFMAAEMVPADYSEPFLAHVAQLLQNAPTADEISRIELLRLYHAYQFNEHDDLRLLKKLRDFAQQHPKGGTGVPLYLVVAADLVAQSRVHLARAVLVQGHSMYYGQQEARELVNQLIILQARPVRAL